MARKAIKCRWLAHTWSSLISTLLPDSSLVMIPWHIID